LKENDIVFRNHEKRSLLLEGAGIAQLALSSVLVCELSSSGGGTVGALFPAHILPLHLFTTQSERESQTLLGCLQENLVLSMRPSIQA